VYDLSHSAWILGLVNTLQFLPVLLFSLFSGVIADRYPKRNLLRITNATAFTLSIILAVLSVSGLIEVWHIVILALLLGVVNSLDMPSRQAFVKDLVGKEDLQNAVAMNASCNSMARMIGPAVGGMVITAFGVSVCFFLNAASFLVMLIGLTLMNSNEIYRASGIVKQAMWTGLREGVGFVLKTKSVRTAIFSVFIVSSFGMVYQTLNPLLARDVFFVDAQGYGLMLTVMGAGSLCSGFTIAFVGRKSTPLLICTSLFGIALLELIISFTNVYAIALVFFFFLGFCVTSSSTNANSLVQTHCPDALQGRVMSTYTMMFNGARPIGSFTSGIVAELLGPQVAMGFGGVAVFFGALYALITSLHREPKNVPHTNSRARS
jgi:MFS family permease